MKKRRLVRVLFVGWMFFCSTLLAKDFTVASFNCGGLPDHYDYLRSNCMQKLIQKRYNTEPGQMAQLERIQNTALKILFTPSIEERESAIKEWHKGCYGETFLKIIEHPDEDDSGNRIWKEKSEEIISSYKERPVVIFDKEVLDLLDGHLRDLTQGQGIVYSSINDKLNVVRTVMVKRILQNQLQYDIIALQEADYLDSSLFPQNYDVRFSQTDHSINAVAWNKEKFELVNIVGNISCRGFILELKDIESGQVIAVASGHLSGCNPFRIEIDKQTGRKDSSKGDQELMQILEALDKLSAEIKVLAMDSNVTAMHPRLFLLKNAAYKLDYHNFLDPTCTNPWLVLNTRIDWIAVSSSKIPLTIHNIPVLGVGLNCPQSNMSDHKPNL